MTRQPALRRGGAATLGLVLILACAAAARAQELLSTPDRDEAPINVPADRSTGGAPLSLDAGDTGRWTEDSGQLDEAGRAVDAEQGVDPDQTDGEPTEEAGADLEANPVASIRLGVLPRRDAGRTLQALSGLGSRLSDTLGRSVEFVPVSSYSAMIDAQMLGRIDGGFYSTSAFAKAESLCKCLEPAVTPTAADGTTAFYGIIVAPQAAALSRITDLNGAVAATARPDSVGGTRLQIASLLADGIDVRAAFSGFVQTASPEAAVEAMLAGEADVAFAWSSLSGPASSGYSRGTLTFLAESGGVDPESVKILWRSPPIAHGPLALAMTVPAGDRAAVTAVLIGLKEDDRDAYDALEPFYSGGYEASAAEDYRGASVLAMDEVDAVLVGLRGGGVESSGSGENPAVSANPIDGSKPL